MPTALYEVISNALIDGALPDGFSLPRDEAEADNLADGAAEGILTYHRAPGHQLSPEQTALIARAVEEVSAGKFYDAEETIWDIASGIGPFDAYDALRRYIVGHAGDLSMDNLFRFAAAEASRSPVCGVVKIALCMLSVFDPGDRVREIIRTLGLSDAFTLYSALAMGAWEDTNAEWFALAQKVRGWGRIQLVARIRPETEAIRRWLLREGVHNSILPAYSALTCWVKADVPGALSGPLSPEDLRGIRDIIEALLDEGPVAGISGVEDAEVHVLSFLEKMRGVERDADDRSVILDIRDHFGDSAEVVRACDAVLNG